MAQGLSLHISSNYGCFTRPEFKAERMTYDVITPSAARGIMDAIYWKPGIRWYISEIKVLKPIQYVSMCRMEVRQKISIRSIQDALNGFRDFPEYNATDDHTLNHSQILRDVSYIIKANFDILPESPAEKDKGKHIEIARRRAIKGQFFHQPYMGVREFPISFRLVDQDCDSKPIEVSQDFGITLFDINFDRNASSQFYNCVMKNGIIKVPHYTSHEVMQ